VGNPFRKFHFRPSVGTLGGWKSWMFIEVFGGFWRGITVYFMFISLFKIKELDETVSNMWVIPRKAMIFNVAYWNDWL
jgi:hypothetical protein